MNEIKRSRLKGFILVGLIACITGIYIQPKTEIEQPVKETMEVNRPKINSASVASIPQQFLEEQNRKVLDAYIKLEDSLKKEKADHVKVYTKSIKHMAGLENFFNRELMYNRIMDDLLSEGKTIEIAEKTLVDHNYARSTFGEEQALFRVSAIKVLKHEAKNGNLEPLLDTIYGLKTILNQEDYSIQKGQLRDLEDLLSSYIKSIYPDDIMNDFEGFISQIGYDKSEGFKPEVEEVYDDAIYLSLQRHVDRKKLASIISKYFD